MNNNGGNGLTADNMFKCPFYGKYIDKNRCLNTTLVRQQNTAQCSGHKCKCPWRLCIKCIYEKEITHFREYPKDKDRCKVVDSESGLCAEHLSSYKNNGKYKPIEASGFIMPQKKEKEVDMEQKFKEKPWSERIEIIRKSIRENEGNRTKAMNALETNFPMILECEALFNLHSSLLVLLDAGKITVVAAKEAARLAVNIQKNIAEKIKEHNLKKRDIVSLIRKVSAEMDSGDKKKQVDRIAERSVDIDFREEMPLTGFEMPNFSVPGGAVKKAVFYTDTLVITVEPRLG